MIYNKTHDEYRLGAGLYFKLIFSHNDHPGAYTATSNIPAINMAKLKAKDQEKAKAEVLKFLKQQINLKEN